ncbi:MAG: DUF4445 domain-containing protein [Planctomycetes bacterium]|nr:DUF4445 domain-containing protein [Planctomycetota bacterium]
MGFSITFRPLGVVHRAAEPTFLSEAAAQVNVCLEHPCGGQGHCRGCRVRFDTGAPEPTASDRERFSSDQLMAGWRLSCLAIVKERAVVTVHADPFAARGTFGPEHITVSSSGPIVPLENAQTPAYGLAIDLGSTTLAMALVDLRTRRVLAARSALDPQVTFGADVVSRIQYATENPDGNAALTHALRRGLAELATQTLAETNVAPDAVIAGTACGNATLSHAFAGSDVRPLGQFPYQGGIREAQRFLAGDLDLPIRKDAPVHLFPQVGGHLGGDVVAGVLATAMDRTPGLQLLIDLGTNTEIVLGDGERLLAASTAAGPAFEGAAITCGMRAKEHAIDRVALDPARRLRLRVRGGATPHGLCGTGMIDAIACLLALGAIEPSGRMHTRASGSALEEEARRRLVSDQPGHHGVRLSDEGVHPQVVLTAHDVRQVQLAKSAIAAGIRVLLHVLGRRVEELDAIHLAGAFGQHLRKETAIQIGLVPAIDPERIVSAGDTAGFGSRLALCDVAAWKRAQRIAERIEPIELAMRADYLQHFASLMDFRPMREEFR